MSDEKKAPSIYELLMYMTEQMSAVSWQKLGLQPDMVTGKLEANLAEARVAIDVTAYLVSQIEHNLDEDDKRQVQRMVRDLRINYVQKNNDAGGSA